jgi:two-component system LytT family response regulator
MKYKMEIKTKLKCIIVEDEEHSRKYLSSLLAKYCKELIILDEIATVNNAILSIEKNKPDLVFLDIELGGESGFAILEALNGKVSFDIIFVTAFQEYAINAFKYAAVSYLLKPINLEELQESIERIKQIRTKINTQKQIDFLLEMIKRQQKTHDCIAVPTFEGFTFIKISDIIRLEADGSYTMVYFKSTEPILVCKNISYFEELFTETCIIRIHKSSMVNIQFVKKYIKHNGGHIVMADNTKIKVSERKRAEFLELIQKL